MMQKTPAKKVKESPAKKNLQRAGIALLLLFLLGGVAWAWQSYSKYRTYGKITDQAVALMGKPDSDYEIDRLREQLPDGYFQKFRDFMDQQDDRLENQRMRDFFALTKDQQNAELDKRIADEDRRDKRRDSWQKQRDAERAASAAKQGSGSGGSGNSGNNSGGQNQSAGSGGGGGGRSRLLSTRLDDSTPEHRAMRAAYRTMASERRAAAGLPPRRSPRLRF